MERFVQRRWLPVAVLVLILLALVVRRVIETPAVRSQAAGAASTAAPQETEGPHRGVESPAPASKAARASDDLPLVGRVLDPDGMPVEGARVVLVQRPADSPCVSMGARTAITAADGGFRFESERPGSYLLEAQSDTATSPTTPVKLAPGSEPATLIVFSAAVLTVHVLSAEGGKPVAGALVKVGIGSPLLGGSDAFRQETTDDRGRARFTGITRTVNHPLWVEADGFAGAYANVRAEEHGSLEWETVVALDPGAVIRGRIVDRAGNPIAGAKIGWEVGKGQPDGTYGNFIPFADGGRYAAVISDARGEFNKRVSVGTGCLVAVDPRHLTAQACELRAEAGRSLDGVEIQMADGAVIEGVVVAIDGAPVPRADVLVTRSSHTHEPMWSDTYRVRALTDASGRFVLEGIDPQDVALVAYADDGSTDLVGVSLRGAERKRGVVLRLTNTGTISGRVVEEGGSPVPFATVEHYVHPDFEATARGWSGSTPHPPIKENALPRSTGGTTSDGQGRFSLRGLPPGKYTVRAARPERTAVLSEAVNTYVHDVAVGASVTLTLPGLGAVTGRVARGDGRPVTALEIALVPATAGAAGQMQGGAVSAPDGVFKVERVPAGRYTVAIAASGLVTWRSDKPVVVKASSATDVGLMTLRDGQARSGVVLDEDRRPIARATVVCAPVDKPDRVQLAESDAQGRFVLPAMPTSTPLLLRATTDNGASEWSVVQAESSTVEIVIEASTRGSVRGVIIDPGRPLAGRMAVLMLPGEGTPGAGHRSEATTQTAEGGLFSFEKVPAGSYVVWVRREGSKDGWGSVPVTVERQLEAVVSVDLSRPAP